MTILIKIMFAENCAAYQIEEGKHTNPGENSILIQIADLDGEFPKPLHKFKEIYQFKFLDVEDHDKNVDQGISDAQALEITKILLHARFNKMNVIVNCVMGLCRSGAVVDAAASIGFEETRKTRIPNTTVKKKIFKYMYELLQNE